MLWIWTEEIDDDNNRVAPCPRDKHKWRYHITLGGLWVLVFEVSDAVSGKL